MKTYRSPVYPALMINLGTHMAKARGGLFEIDDEDVATFEALIAKSPHYRVEAVEADEAAAIAASPPDVVGGVVGTLTSPKAPDRTAVAAPRPTRAELSAELESLGLPTDGNVPDLEARLAEARSAGAEVKTQPPEGEHFTESSTAATAPDKPADGDGAETT